VAVKREGPTHRQRQALATKEQIARAARDLFATQGYVATTITAIAEAADIPAPTIYSAMGSKAAILLAIGTSIAGKLDPFGRHAEALAQADPAEGLRIVARLQRDQFEAMYDVIAVYQEAARTDPEIAQAIRTILGNRERAFRRHVEHIADHLVPGVSADDAVSMYAAFVLPEIYRTFVVERGWSNDKYEAWLAENLIRQLLSHPCR
jgi:AcrR family transcriptional regulator